jgi:energy-coupling factor transporter transmembrane protein EcfT
MLKINIITQLLGFFMLDLIVNLLNIKELLLILIILIAILSLNKNQQFLQSIKRFKWFILVMIVIFSFNTPGEHIREWPFSISPSYEGLSAGLTQTLRIVAMLAALALIMAINSRQDFISGFYFIFSPLKYLGLEVERFAARLWLTLHYVELQRDNNANQNLLNRLKEMANLQLNQNDESVAIQFKMPQFGTIDYVAITLLLLVLLKVVL